MPWRPAHFWRCAASRTSMNTTRTARSCISPCCPEGAVADPTDFRIDQHTDGWRRISPTPSPESLAAFYAGEYYQASHGTYAQRYSDEELAHRRLLAAELIHALARARGRSAASGDCLVEIGCGEGFFLRAATDAGFDVQGLEF